MFKKIIIGFVYVIAVLFMIILDPFSKPSTSSHVNNQQNTNKYVSITTNNILKTYNKTKTTNIKLSKKQYQTLYKAISNNTYHFRYDRYYGLDEALSLYNKTSVNKKTSSDLLDDTGLLDVNKLVAQVQNNNKNYMSQTKDAVNAFYKEMNSSDIYKICNIICEVINAKYINTDINKTANTLMNLKMFEKTGSASNAYVTHDLTFVYNPSMTSMYSSMQSITGTSQSQEETFKAVITHEIMHLLQYSSSDNYSDNGLEAGFTRMYNIPNEDKKIPVDSLWYSWLLEASAELSMADYLKVKTGTYAKKISYVNSFHLSHFHNLNLENNSLEDIAFYSKLEDIYKALNLKTNKEKQDFLKFMYSIEITQSDPDDFWDHYSKLTQTSPNEEEKLNIRMTIREDAVKYLTSHFYLNLLDAIYEGKINDLNTLFYFMKLWEIDAYSHLEYTKISSCEYAQEFTNYQHTLQNHIFDIFVKTIPDIKEQYNEYTLQYKTDSETTDNCNLDKYSSYTKKYLISLKNNYNTAHFASSKAMYDYYNERK